MEIHDDFKDHIGVYMLAKESGLDGWSSQMDGRLSRGQADAHSVWVYVHHRWISVVPLSDKRDVAIAHARS